jgi:hypothetical protein
VLKEWKPRAGCGAEALGCDELQGYLVSKPVTFEQIAELLHDERRPIRHPGWVATI